MTTRAAFAPILLALLFSPIGRAADAPKARAAPSPTAARPNSPSAVQVAPAPAPPSTAARPPGPLAGGLALAPSLDDLKGLRSVALLGLASLAPAALLMFTSFVRINIVLTLLRQALGARRSRATRSSRPWRSCSRGS